MSEPDDGSGPEAHLPSDLVATLDSLDIPELRAVIEYARTRIDEKPHAIEDDIRASDAENIVSIDDRGAYALVTKQDPANGQRDGGDTITSLYLVRHERGLDGETSLNWAYLGDVETDDEIECRKCGASRSRRVDTCPQCGADLDTDERE